MLYFAYGSNLNHEQMKRRCSGAKYIKKHTLKSYKLCFSHKTKHSIYGHANIVKNKKSKVLGALWNINKKDEKLSRPKARRHCTQTPAGRAQVHSIQPCQRSRT